MKWQSFYLTIFVVACIVWLAPAAWSGMNVEEFDTSMPRYHGKFAKDPCVQDVMLLSEDASLWQYTNTGWVLVDDTLPVDMDLMAYEYLFYYDSLKGYFTVAIQYVNPARWRFWQYKTTGWEQLPSDFGGPAPRYDCAYTWDNNDQQLVMFGGYNWSSSAALGDTWVWTGTQWEPQMPIECPPAQGGVSMVHAPMLGEVQLLAEDKIKNPGYMAVWTWNGMDWSYNTASAGVVPVHKKATLIRDTDQDRLVMFGGYLPGGDKTVTNDLWFWDEASWVDGSSNSAPSPRYGAPGVFVNDQVVIFGGLVNSSARDHICDTWEYNDVDEWTQLYAVPPYTPYSKRITMTWDPMESRGVLLTPADTTPKSYEWKNHAWRDLVDSLPDKFAVNELVYDPNDDIFLLQAINISGLKCTYIHDRTCWMEQSPDHQPMQRECYPMVYHPIRNAPVIFGGLVGISYVPFITYTASNKLYEWVDNDWQSISMTDPWPPELFAHAMAYDSHRGRLVVAGGTLIDNSAGPSELTPSPDVWEWDGNCWFQYTCSTYPVGTGSFQMVYDPVRRRCVLPTSDGGIWEWDGANWHIMATDIFGEADDVYGATVYDPDNSEVVVQAVDLMKTYIYKDSDPETCADLGVDLDMPDTMYSPGDTFYCDAHICNTTGMVLDGYPLFVLLDVCGEYFWGPGWTNDLDCYLEDVPSLAEGETVVTIIPPFKWPKDVGAATGIGFIGAITDPEIRILYGDFISIEFGWSAN